MSKKLWSDHKNMKSLMEGWRGFINEEEPPAKAPGQDESASEDVPDSKLAAAGVTAEQLMGMELPSFIQAVQSSDGQKAILDGLNDGNEDDDKFEIVPTAIPVKNLRPTQNEVVLEKSIPFNLFNQPKQFLKFRASNGPFAVGKKGVNDAIITFNGEFIIDGHHRWSSLYCVNPNASIEAFDIRKSGQGNEEDAKDVLKAVQAAILQDQGSIPNAQGGGINLFTIDGGTFKKWLIAKFKDDPGALKTFAGWMRKGILKEKADQPAARGSGKVRKEVINTIYNIIWPNIESLQQNSTPISGATERPSMPQADRVGKISHGAGIPAAVASLQKGIINTEKPFSKMAAESRTRPKRKK